jgi:hypothetical protein
MLFQQTAPNESVRRLIADGYEVDISQQHILVRSVPFVNAKREVELGTLVSQFTEIEEPGRKLNDHTLWFQGGTPCTADGKPIRQLTLDDPPQTLFGTFKVHHRFSNKPAPAEAFPANYYDKMVHYVDLLVAQARVIDPNADARTGIVIESREDDPIFRYPDSASARAGILAISQKLALSRVAIVGLGGTGSYILDQVVKTPVREIHLFDGDELKRHNGFRMPGAISIPELHARPKKVDFFHAKYDVFRFGIIPHAYHLDSHNIAELDDFDFVFVSVDDGPSRKLICTHLAETGIPFADVGMGIVRVEESLCLSGGCRVTLGSKFKTDHLPQRLPVNEDRDNLYKSNIQVADINALNAILAVIRWKQLCGFYLDYENPHEMGFSIAMNSIFIEDTIKGDN